MRRVATMQQWTTPLAAAILHHLAIGIFVAEPDGRVHYLNRAAQDILAAKDGLMLRDELLSARRSFETALRWIRPSCSSRRRAIASRTGR